MRRSAYKKSKKAQIIGVPLDLGAGRRGVDMGPSALRICDIQNRLQRLGYDVIDAGNVHVPIAETQHYGHEKLRFLPEIVKVCMELSLTVEKALVDGYFPLTLGGDHSLAIGSVAGVASFYKKRGAKFGLIYFDAHGDMNIPESTPSGNIHGMPLAVCLGLGAPELTGIGGFQPKLDAGRCALLGVRALDEREKRIVADSGITVFTMRDIDEKGMSEVMREALKIATMGSDGFHVSFDMDILDPSLAPGVGTAAAGGVTYREAHLAMEIVADSGLLTSFDLVEINPVLDNANATAVLGTGLILSAMGKRIL